MARRSNPWVKLSKAIKFPHGPEPAGTVGIEVGPAKTLDADEKVVDIPGYSEVHLVHAASGVQPGTRVVDGFTVNVEIPYRGGDTRAVVAVKTSDFVLVTDRNDVPAERLATYEPDWQPRAASRV